MISKKYILATIKSLETKYNNSPVPESTFYAKLAIIELCGWIELTMDYIVDSFTKKKLKTIQCRDIFQHSIKGRNSGFDYKKNFRKMLYQTIGIHNYDRLEKKLNKDPGTFTKFQTELKNLKKSRNDAAHTYIDSLKTYQAPSVTISQFSIIYPVLKQIHTEVKKL